MVSFAVFEIDPSFAVNVTVETPATLFVAIVNVADSDPLGIVTATGTVAFALLDSSLTTVLEVAIEASETVPVTSLPPVTEDADKLRLARTGAETVMS